MTDANPASPAGTVPAALLRRWLHGDTAELALLDVRETGEQAEGHILFSAPLPYSRFELDLPRLAPNAGVRMVLCDGGDGIAARAAARARSMGYADVHVLEGGVAAWAAAGHTLYQGVNVPSKAFGELVEHECRTPRIAPGELDRMRSEGRDVVVVDGRTPAEFARMNIPGAAFCPNGELALRIDRLAPDPTTTVVVNCAGRTRSIIGAQTLIDLGLPNPVLALENGTQGWMLAGLTLERGARPALPGTAEELEGRRSRAEAMAARHGVVRLDADRLAEWLRDPGRTVYLLDVRPAEERAVDPAPLRDAIRRHGVVHAPGGQLVQAADQWIGVRRSRVVVLDTEGVRAPVTASWLARQGHETAVVEGGLATLEGIRPRAGVSPPALPALPGIGAAELAELLRDRRVTVLDLRASAAFREGHVRGARWAIRPRLPEPSGPVVLVADDWSIAALAAIDLSGAGASDIRLLEGGVEAWRAAGLPLEMDAGQPTDAERIDFVFFTYGRHEGDAEASRRYLSWEIGLVDQLDADERAVFRV